MHGVIGLATTALRNRRGGAQLTAPKNKKDAKRLKLGYRPPAKAGRKPNASVCYLDTIVPPPPSLRELSAMQPHRRHLPDPLDDRAGTVLGELLLLGGLAPHSFNRMTGKYQPSQEAQGLYRAGCEYARVVGAYRATLSAPRGTAGAGRGYDCKGEQWCGDDGHCECERRVKAFNEAHSVLKNCAPNPIFGQRVVKVMSRVVVFDEPCPQEALPLLVMGLRALDKSKEK